AAAYILGEGIQVTYNSSIDHSSPWLAGRATYTKPLHLWDKESTDLASFSTSFTFVIDSYAKNDYGDGLTFFLAHENTVINAGGSIGLPFDFTTKTTSHQFVGVEFDTYGGNEWDPTDPDTNISIDDHVGIDINSITSVVSRKWVNNITVLLRMGLAVGTFIVVTSLAILAYFLWRRKKNVVDEEELGLLEMNNAFEMEASMPRRFSYHQLDRATSNFAETRKLREGCFGGVYKGFLDDLRMYVAVKRVSQTSRQGIKEYASESMLTWNTRYKIAYGLASVLLYLHEEWEQCVLHRDIKSSNVMLDSKFNVKLGDFGLAKLVDHEKGMHKTMLVGTFGYIAPECIATGISTKESDAFSFGVVALEIACGRKAVDYIVPEKQIQLVQWVWELYGNDNLLEAVDPSPGSEFEEEEVKRLMVIGLWSVHPYSEVRPSMRQVINVLNSEASMPLLPSKMPVAYYEPPIAFSLSNFCSTGQYQSLSLEPPSTESSN
ncbi:hypothetical protein M8C21_024864, partial [Ambrosia artemisiifolia]